MHPSIAWCKRHMRMKTNPSTKPSSTTQPHIKKVMNVTCVTRASLYQVPLFMRDFSLPLYLFWCILQHYAKKAMLMFLFIVSVDQWIYTMSFMATDLNLYSLSWVREERWHVTPHDEHWQWEPLGLSTPCSAWDFQASYTIYPLLKDW